MMTCIRLTRALRRLAVRCAGVLVAATLVLPLHASAQPGAAAPAEESVWTRDTLIKQADEMVRKLNVLASR